ncbi:HNH endonuclease signature motif containing protein [Streptomyces tendae]|uniref:HNH endonuclease signature motif containing protein n=1 Tax=Streptomyces tendae TaxID=1932 RepID=UPI0036B8004F
MHPCANPVPGFPDYLATDDGRIYSKPRRRLDGRRIRGRWLKGSPNSKGYLTVHLYRDGRYTKGVHVLVAEAFHGPRPAGQVVRHLNGDPSDNRASNLTYGTQSENTRDAVRHGTHGMARRTHCPNGHPLEGDNLRPDRSGFRLCLACDRVRARVRRSRAAGRNFRDPFGRALEQEPAGRTAA